MLKKFTILMVTLAFCLCSASAFAAGGKNQIKHRGIEGKGEVLQVGANAQGNQK